MIRIGISQRVDVAPHRGERRDCLDQNWFRLMDAAGFLGIALSNVVARPEPYLNALNLDGLILSGGNNLATLGDVPDIASERDIFERAAIEWATAQQMPVLGICRGLQIIYDHCGGILRPLTGHVAVRHPLITQDIDPILPIPKEVNSFHEYGMLISDVAAPLRVVASAEDGSVEAVRHNTLPWVGIMWHPEREPTFRSEELALLRNMFNARR